MLSKILWWASIAYATSNYKFTTIGRATVSSSSIVVPAGSNYVETERTFTRPVDVTVQMRQSDGLSAECGVVAVFPDSSTRHSGYNAGLGWWASYFGTGSPNPAQRVASDVYWHTIRISILQSGVVNYYLDGVLRHTETNSKYTSGKIRFGNNCREYTYKNLDIIENFGGSFKVVGSARVISDDNIVVPAGSNYVETTKVYTRPIDVTVEMRQSDGLSSECGVMAVFPTSTTRHSGYNAGLGWWGNYFGAGSSGAGRYGDTNGKVSDWHTVRVSVQNDGVVEYYLDGALKHTVKDTQFDSGTIRLGYNCREFSYRNLKVIEDYVPIDPLFTAVGAAEFKTDGSVVVNAGSNYVETTRTYARPIDVTVDMRQSDGQSPECGVVAVFPTSTTRHSGYNAGLGWWASYFGTGSPTGGQRGDTNGAISNWHTIRISVLQNGMVKYYLDGIHRHTDHSNDYTSGKIRLGSNCRQFTYRNLNVVEHYGVVPVIVPGTPKCQPGQNVGSANTQNMLAKLGPAATKFAECDEDIQSIGGSLTTVSDVASDVRLVTKNINKVMTNLNDIIERILAPPPKGAGIADMLGKIPKVGILIKIYLKSTQTMLDKVEDIAAIINRQAKRVDDAVNVMEGIFKYTGMVTGPTARYLTKSHEALTAAHGCAQSTGYLCGTAAGWMEEKNGEAYPLAKKPLEDIATAGQTCHEVLNPVEGALEELEKVARALAKLLQPINTIIDKIAEVMKAVNRLIEEFKKLLLDSDVAQCALSIFEPVTDVFNLLSCPVMEAAGAATHFIIDEIMRLIEGLIDDLINEGITKAVDAIVPDNLNLEVFDFQELLPTDFWMAVCTAASLKYPEHAHDIQTLANLPLPYKVTSDDIKDSILSKALVAVPLTKTASNYNSACVEAWNSMGVDIDACVRLFKQIHQAACDAAKHAHQANAAALQDAQREMNRAKANVDKEKRHFDHAVNQLNNEQRKFDNAKNDLHNARRNCPNCHCGSCCWYCAGCHAETVWCCPAKGVCHGAISIASGTMDACKATLEVAKGTVNAAKHTLDVAQVALDVAKGTVRGYELASQTTLAAVRDSCGRRRVTEDRLLRLEAPVVDTMEVDTMELDTMELDTMEPAAYGGYGNTVEEA